MIALAPSPGGLWAGTASGLNRFDKVAETFEQIPLDAPDPYGTGIHLVLSLLEDGDGVVWMAVQGRGVYEYRPVDGVLSVHQSWTWDARTISSNWTSLVYQDRAGVIWAATALGLNAFDRSTRQWRRFYHDDTTGSLSDDTITSILEDRQGRLWIGTASGLNMLDRESGAFRRYGAGQGLAGERIAAMLEDDQGMLWLATNRGLSRFDPERGTFRNYDSRDGIQADTYNPGAALHTRQGELLFGGNNGIVGFFPEQLVENRHVPPVVLTGVRYSGSALPPATSMESMKSFTLRWPARSFEFDFAVLDYAQPERNQHAYMLKGFDTDWTNTGAQGSGKYTNLPAGTYTLIMRGANNDGVWNEAGVSLKVTVVPPLWETLWLRGLALLGLAGAVMAGYRWRVNSIHERSRHLESLVAQRTAELEQETTQRVHAEEALRKSETEKAVAAERRRLARDLHDSVTQSLYGITLYAQAASSQLAAGQTEKVAAHLGQLSRTAHEALTEMRLLVFELRTPVLEEEGLAGALQARLQAVEGRAGLKTEFETNLVGRLPPKIEEALYHIALEALNNAIKHAQARTITVGLQRASQGVTLVIADDGVGFVAAEAQA